MAAGPSRHFALARAAVAALLLGYVALVVTVLVRMADLIADIVIGDAAAVFDDGPTGLDVAMVPALWQQWFVLWGAILVLWPVVLALAAQALAPYSPAPLSPLQMAGRALIPGLATLTTIVAFKELGEALGTKTRSARIVVKAAIAVPYALLVGLFLTFAWVFAKEAFSMRGGQVLLVVCVFAPLVLPISVRCVQLWAFQRALAEVELRVGAEGIRVSHATSAGG